MFPKTWLYFFFCGLLFGLGAPAVQACAVGEHHSTCYHYNKAHQVFVGRLLKQEKHSTDTLLLTYKVEQAFRHCRVGEQVQVLASAYNNSIALANKRHLIYAEPTPTAALYCPKVESLDAPATKRQLRLIKKIIKQPSGVELVEYSTYGRVWARGYYHQGQPCATWRFYAYSGELQLEGGYNAKGAREGEWRQHQHTLDATYKVLHAILVGDYARQWNDYQVLGVDTTVTTVFRYALRYLVGQDTVVEQFYYNRPICSKKMTFQAGLPHGEECWYDEEGGLLKLYTFEQGYLQGRYQERVAVALPQKGYIQVQGSYHQDKKQEEIHYYYDEQGAFLYLLVLIEEGRVLAAPRREAPY